ncbi:hypothetical protein C8241_07740 [Paracidovorax avenae]|uniref:DUF6172 family protein n=1 Tax=Paracidovorax avenae TaxID=80867 RepID=UPI000D1744A9|nr:DUF6172 family protein [Paracidovorax avenae]AVS61617.1 hypothetical protein C8241_07740 [Paracidovorax avenae]
MRKTYVLHIDGKNRDRLLDAARHDIHRYLRRERRRALPEGARFWDFDCRFGRTQDDARSVQVEDITRLIDGVAQSGDTQFYVEIVAKPGEGMLRKPAARPADSGGDGPHDEDGDGADGGADGGGDGGD